MADDDSTRQGGLFAHFEKLAQEAQAFPPAPDAKPVEPEPLGVWGDDRRGAPNVVLRAAVFCAGKPTKTRKLYRDHVLPAAIGTKSITYTGPQLYQYELDVWLEVVHRCRMHPAGTTTDFHVHGFLRTLRRSVGKANYKQLHATMGLLQATSIKVVLADPAKSGYRGQLVRDFVFNDELCRWEVTLHPEIAELFAPKEHTWLHVDARLDLGKNYLAKWLHGYFSSHRKPLPIGVQRLCELSGSSAAALRTFRQSLRSALAEITAVEKSYGRRFEWHIDERDLVHVARESGN
jgi:hypothetical protein